MFYFFIIFEIRIMIGRFQRILTKRFLQNFTASSFRLLRFLSNCMLTAQHKTENLVCSKSVKFTA